MFVRCEILKNLRMATASAALLASGSAIAIAFTPAVAIAQDHGGGHETDSHETDSGHESGGKQSGKGRAPGESSEARGHRSMEDIYRAVADAADEDSDRPSWAGGGGGKNDRGEPPSSAGSTRGDLYGDLYVILRDDNGIPILNEDGFVQPLDSEGNLVPLDEEGAPLDPTLVTEVELSRLNVGRSPDSVLETRADEVVALLSTATALTTDPAGRLVVTSPDGSVKTIDAPLENLALYVALMTEGTIPGVSDLPGDEFDFMVDGEFTTEDIAAATSLLAGASDKFDTLSPDAIAYMNAILEINLDSEGDVSWSDVDYSTYSYDREDTYGDATTTVLVKQTDGSWLPTEVNIYEEVFGGDDYSGTGTFDAFAQAVDDSREVINYIHEYAVPADELPTSE